MLNTLFPSKSLDLHKIDSDNYILPVDLQRLILSSNHDLMTEKEFRLQQVYTDEIWDKINSLLLSSFSWADSVILDVASGSGYLSYHLLKKIKPKELTLLDISPSAISESKKLLGKEFPDINIVYKESDILKSDLPSNTFNVIIGNSFIHHFYDVPEGLSELNRLLKPGGVFISIHEPTPAAVAYESGKFRHLLLWLVRGKKYVEDIRKLKGDFELEKNIGGDVWLFEEEDIKKLLSGCNFENIIIKPRHIVKSFIVGLLKIHLSKEKNKLNIFETRLIKFGISMDNILSKVLPSKCFGSFVICAFKKK